MKFRILDLFAGAGGFSLGLDSIEGFKSVIAVDFDKNALSTFKANIKDSITICADLTNSESKKEIIALAKKENINMIIGGPPCQGFSLKGKKLGLDDKRNFLFLEFIDIVKEINPEVFVIENVKNLIKACDGYFIKQILQRFNSLSYIVNYGTLNAKNFGIPQNRERAIIIGSKSKSIELPIKEEKIVSVKDAISDLAYLNSSQGEFESSYKMPIQSDYQKKLRGKNEVLYNHKATSHSKIALEKLSLIPAEGDKSSLPIELHGKQKFKTTWSRLVWNEISPTIDTRFDTPSNGKNSHPVLNRAITAREAARIQSFPDNFIFLGKKVSICKQVGNAVPPLLARAIGKRIIESYENEDKNIKYENFQLYLANSLSFVKQLKAENILVDAIITDPPYNISKDNNFSTLRNPRTGVNFGQWDIDFDPTIWIKEYSSLLKKDGCMIIFCSYLYISYIIDELKNNNIDIKDILVWQKSNPMPRNVNRRYVQDMEFAIWAVKKNSKWTFNKPKDIPYLRSTFKTSLVSGSEKTGHPTQKSLTLMKEIIKIHTNENDIILDPFMGSGTTALAAIENNRKFIGIEIDEKYFNLAKKRIIEKVEKS